MNPPVVESGAFGGDLACGPENLSGDRVTCGVPSVAWEEPLLRLAPEATPVSAQCFKQLRAEHHVAVLAALALPDMNHHALAVDVAHL